MKKSNLVRKLTSRKFWLAVAGFVSMLVVYFTGNNSNAESVSALIMAGASVFGYLIGEGLADSNGYPYPDNSSDPDSDDADTESEV